MTKKFEGAARAIADLSGGTILASVDIAAPAERVFRALTTSEEILRWWGADDAYRTTSWVSDFRVGGKWRAEGCGADGQPFAVEGEFLEIEAPRRVVQSWRADWDGAAPTVVAFQLEPIATGTRVTVRHDGFQGRPEACKAHTEGWTRVLGWLTAHVRPGEAAADGQFFMCRLIPPRMSFAFGMTDEEKAVMQAHVSYLEGGLGDGRVIVFGPVADPNGPYGLGIFRMPDEAALSDFLSRDPAIRSELGLRYEVLPMMAAKIRE